jgi:hypothetical protein
VIKLPEEREVIVPVVGGELLCLLQQPLDTSLFLLQHLSHLLAEGGIICQLLRGMQHVGEDRKQVFGCGAILLVEQFECFFAEGVNARHAFEKHFDDGIASGDLGLEEQAADQGLPFGKGDLLEFCDVKDPGLCRQGSSNSTGYN